MLLWLVLAGMTAGVVGLLLHPLLAETRRAEQTSDGTAAVYRDQLAEIDAEAGRGLIGGEEAEAARREIARRLLARDAQATVPAAIPATPGESAGSRSRRLALPLSAMIGILLPLLAIATYVQTGAPDVPAQPIAARRSAPPVNPEMARLVATVEARLKENPDDGRGWDAIAPAYLRLGRFADAATAYTHANRILGETPKRLAGLAEALMFAGHGRVGPQAREALTKLVALDPGHVQARFWLAFAKEQDGDLKGAEVDYDKLLADAPADASWRPMVEERRQAVRSAATGNTEKPAAPREADASRAPAQPARGPTAADVAAAERMTAGDRQAMIDGMVSNLASRLEPVGKAPAGGQRLIRVWGVLGRAGEGGAAPGRARKSLGDEPQALAALSDLAKTLGLGT